MGSWGQGSSLDATDLGKPCQRKPAEGRFSAFLIGSSLAMTRQVCGLRST